ncbi:MAG: exodeoxyribonuclease VII small subunit [Euryarchaeota archaeon]|nr:exodeoxyribonuclease VII small subunit [Euryarchaeota archaeon]
MDEGKEIGTMKFEEAMKELETIVQTLEKGDLKLETSLTMYERAVALRDHCQKILDTSERKVQRIVDGEQGQSIEDFE